MDSVTLKSIRKRHGEDSNQYRNAILRYQSGSSTLNNSHRGGVLKHRGVFMHVKAANSSRIREASAKLKKQTSSSSFVQEPNKIMLQVCDMLNKKADEIIKLSPTVTDASSARKSTAQSEQAIVPYQTKCFKSAKVGELPHHIKLHVQAGIITIFEGRHLAKLFTDHKYVEGGWRVVEGLHFSYNALAVRNYYKERRRLRNRAKRNNFKHKKKQ